MSPQASAQIARRTVAITPDDGTNADLAAAMKMLAMVLFHMVSAPTTAVKGPTQFPNMSINEVTGNGRIPPTSSNYGLKAVR